MLYRYLYSVILPPPSPAPPDPTLHPPTLCSALRSEHNKLSCPPIIVCWFSFSPPVRDWAGTGPNISITTQAWISSTKTTNQYTPNLTDISRDHLKVKTQLSLSNPPSCSKFQTFLASAQQLWLLFCSYCVFFAVFPTVMMLSASEVGLHSE